jgi:NADH-ubiquinone oxidoreductase ASHI subunit (CI-ASHI or NDUFB8)
MQIASGLPKRVITHKGLRFVKYRAYSTPIEYDPRPREPDPQLNGYPELPYVNLQHRPPKGWWDIQGRRNFGETVSYSEIESIYSL